AAADVDADGFSRQIIPGKNTEIGIENCLSICRRKFRFALLKSRPLMTETGCDIRVEVSRGAVHRIYVRLRRIWSVYWTRQVYVKCSPAEPTGQATSCRV